MSAMTMKIDTIAARGCRRRRRIASRVGETGPLGMLGSRELFGVAAEDRVLARDVGHAAVLHLGVEPRIDEVDDEIQD